MFSSKICMLNAYFSNRFAESNGFYFPNGLTILLSLLSDLLLTNQICVLVHYSYSLTPRILDKSCEFEQIFCIFVSSSWVWHWWNIRSTVSVYCVGLCLSPTLVAGSLTFQRLPITRSTVQLTALFLVGGVCSGVCSVICYAPRFKYPRSTFMIIRKNRFESGWE